MNRESSSMFPVHHLPELDLSAGRPVVVRRVLGGVQADRVVVAATGPDDIFINLSLSLSLSLSYLSILTLPCETLETGSFPDGDTDADIYCSQVDEWNYSSAE